MSSYGNKALLYATNNIANANKGDRHPTLFRESCAMGNLLAGGELADHELVRTELISAGRQAGLANADIERQVDNGIRRGLQTPRIAPNNLYQPDRKDKIVVAIEVWFDGLDVTQLRPNEIKVAKALAERAIAVRSNVFDGSYRQVAIDAGVAFKSIPRMAGNIPGVNFTPGNRLTGAPTRWTINISEYTPDDQGIVDDLNTTDTSPKHDTTSSAQPYGTSVLCNIKLDRNDTTIGHQGHEIWSTGCGASAYIVWNYMDVEEEYGTREIATALGISRNCVLTSLHYLASYGLAERVDKFTWRKTTKDDLDQSEVRSNNLERRHKVYKAEQALHAVYVNVQKFLRKLAWERRQDGDKPALKAVRNHQTWLLADLKLGKVIFDGGTGEFNPVGIY